MRQNRVPMRQFSSLTRLFAGVFFVAILFLAPRGFAQLISFNPGTSVGFGASPWTPPAVLDPSLTTTGMIRGSSIGTGGTPAGGCYGGAGGWATGGGDPNCFYYTITASCHEISLSNLAGYTRRSSTGPNGCDIYYSLNGAPRVYIGHWNTTSTSGTSGTAGSSVLSGITALQNIPPGTSIKIIFNPTGSTGNWYFTNTSLALSGTAVAVTAPTIGTPPATATIPAGSGTTFSVSGVTSAASYQWQRNTSGISGGTWVDITSATMDPTGTYSGYAATSSATSNTLTLSSVPASWNGYGYRCVVTNCAGSTASAPALLNVTSASCSGTPAAGTAVPSATSFCGNGSTTITLSGGSAGGGITYQWFSSNTPSLPGTLVPGATLAAYTTSTLTDTTYYWCVTTCAISGLSDTSAMGTVMVHPLPTIAAPAGNVCAGGPGATLTASGASTYTWTPATGLSATTGASVTATPLSAMTYTITGTDAVTTCTNTATVSVTYNLNPGALTVTPTTVTTCAGDGPVTIAAAGGLIGPTTVNSGTVTIPSSIGGPGTIAHTIGVAGIPAGAVITGASVKIIDFSAQYQNDYVVNIMAPNGNRLNLINQRGSHTATVTTMFGNTELSSSGVTSLASGSGTYTGVWAADVASSVGGAPYTSNVTAWSSLYSIPNGSWTLSIYNNTGFTNIVTPSMQWSITLTYSYQAPVTWSPSAGLYTDAAGTVPYTGSATNTVYFNPAVVAATTYTATASNGGCTATATAATTVTPLPAVITGLQSICVGGSTTLSSSPSGGTWSGSSGVASINSATGDVTGLAVGTVTMTYTAPGGCYQTADVTVNAMPATITGPSVVCEGSNITMTNSVGGGSWSVSNTNASIDAITGVLTGNTAGTVTASYTLPGGCIATALITVNQTPAAITGTLTVCETSVTILGSSTPGGTWTSASGNVSVGLLSGALTGVTAGTAVVSYTLPNTCYTTAEATVNAMPAAITGTSVLCEASSGTVFSSPSTGTWSASNGNAIVGITTGSVTAVSAGSVTVSYTLANGCYQYRTLTVNALPANISGSPQVCVGSFATAVDITPGGSWSSSGPAVIIGGLTGSMYGASVGTANITYTLASTGCYISRTIVVNDLPSAITGGLGVCVGFTTTLSSASPGGTWSSSNSNATAAAGGIIGGASVGTANITYTLPTGCTTSATVTVNSLPAPIAGPDHVCLAAMQTLTSSTPGGTWSSSNSSRVNVNTATGDITGMSLGTATISYHLGTGCNVTTVISVSPNPPAISGGGTAFCSGSSVTLSNSLAGGTWSTSNSLIATVDPVSGVVTGVNGGPVYIYYTISTGCSSIKFLSVNPTPATIAGLGELCTGNTHVYYSATTGGGWTSSNTAVASAAFSSGVVTGVSAGTTTLSYIMPTGCATAKTVTINASPATITGSPAICQGSAFTFTNAVSGGTWASDNMVSLPLSATGTGIAGTAGTATISYTLMPSGCFTYKTVTVNSVPSVFAVTGGGNFCMGGAGVPVGISGSEFGIAYTLYAGATPTTTVMGTSAAISYGSLTMPGVYTVLATNPVTGCTSDMTGSAGVTALPVVVPTVSVDGAPPAPVCGGAVISYTATPTFGGTSPAYTWWVNGSLAGAGNTYAYAPANGDIVIVRMASNAECRFFDTVSGADTAHVIPTVVPSVFALVLPNDTVCPHTTVTYMAGGSGGGTAPTYSWLVNGAAAGSGTTLSMIPADNDVVECVMISNAACRTSDTGHSNHLNMEVIEALHPAASISASPGLVVKAGTSVTFTATAFGAGASPAYQWYINGGPVSGATQATYTTNLLHDRDSVTCGVTGVNECTSFTGYGGARMTILAQNSVAGLMTGAMHISVVPNPNNGTFVVTGLPAGPAILVVNDVLGRQMLVKRIATTNGDADVTLDNSLPGGVYILNVNSEAGSGAIRFAVTR